MSGVGVELQKEQINPMEKESENLSNKESGKVEFSDTQNNIQKTELEKAIKSLPDNVTDQTLLEYAENIQTHFTGKKCDDLMALLYQKQYDSFKDQLNIGSFILPKNIDKKQSHSASEYIRKLQENIPEDQFLKYNSAFFASEELKQESFLETYKKDMLEAIYGFMTSYNNKVSYKHLLTDSVMKGIVTILSNGSSAKDIQKLSLFLMNSTNIGSMSEITSFNKNNQNEMVDNLFGSLYNLYVEHRSNIDPEKDFVLDSDSPNRDILPNGFTFTTTEEELQKLVDLADQGSSSFVRYAENASTSRQAFHLWSREENTGKSVHINLAADNDTKKALDPSTTINLNRYSTWREYEGVDNTTNSMQTFINTPYLGSIVHLDETLSQNAKNISRISLTEKDFDKYGKLLQERYPDVVFEKALPGQNNAIYYKEGVDRMPNEVFVGKQEFYAGDTQLTNKNTIGLVDADFIFSLNNQILELTSNPDIDPASIRIHIESCASHLPAPEGKTNEELALERGVNMRQMIIDESKKQGDPLAETMFDDIDHKVDGDLAPSKDATKKDIEDLERTVYRKFQYVKVSIKYETVVPKESSSSSTPGLSSNTNKNNIQLNSFSINIPPSQSVKSDVNEKQNKKDVKKQKKSFERINKKI